MKPQEFLTRPLIFYRSYSRFIDGAREEWKDTCSRTLSGLGDIGTLTDEQLGLIGRLQREYKAITSGRFLWVGGTEWLKDPENVYGAYNCSSTVIDSIHAIALQMALSMTGCGIGAMIEDRFISQIPEITTKIEVTVSPMSLDWLKGSRIEHTTVVTDANNNCVIVVGDSRQGWVDAYEAFMGLAFRDTPVLNVEVVLSYVRPKGETINGFGGVANASKLPQLWERLAEITNGAIGRKLNAEEVCLLIDEGSVVVVAGNIRRSAGIKQFDASEKLLKLGLWTQDKDGNWLIDPKKDALRMSNHTRVYHKKPDRDECIEAVRSQYFSGEGAIQWAGETIARCSADLFRLTPKTRLRFLETYGSGDDEQARSIVRQLMYDKYAEASEKELEHRMLRYGLNPCGEIPQVNNFCNLSEVHLNMIDPLNLEEQDQAFHASGWSVAVLLAQTFPEERYQYSREVDPIVGVSFTGLFDFFVNLFGVNWLRWWQAGRPEKWGHIDSFIDKNTVFKGYWRLNELIESDFEYYSDLYRDEEEFYLTRWRESATRGVYEYCDRNNLRHPNRCTTVQPAGSKSLFTNASPGWHPPKASRYIRRMTFARDHSVANAAIAYGYSVIPSQSDKDENGRLLDDAFDPRCTEWLVEVPVASSWADLEGADEIDINKFSALAQFDFYMQVQKHYTTHNTSATIELRQDEIEIMGDRIFQAIRDDEGYVSCAFLGRYDDLEVFPRLPFEPINKETYDKMIGDVLDRRMMESFHEALQFFDNNQSESGKKRDLEEAGPAGCDSDKCLFPNAVVSG